MDANGREKKVYDNILQCIGNTPIVRLNRIPKSHGLECEMYAKCEFLNPGGSIKDRISYTMVQEAEKSGLAKAGTRFVEPTSGNTGIGVSLTAAVRGYGCTIVTPDKNSDEKMSTMSLLGAEIVQTPAMASYEDPESFVSVTNRLLQENPNAISMDQYSNEVNPITHYDHTAEEILDALGTVDMFVMGSGTGGTVTGVGRKLKEKCPKCIIVTVDPLGSYSNEVNPITHYDHTAEEILDALGSVDMFVMGSGTGGTVTGVGRKLKEKCPKCIIVTVDPLGSIIFGEGKPVLYYVEGIGGDFVPNVLDKSVIDKVVKPNDYQSFNMSREIIRKEGLLCGGSSGAITYSAIQAAKEFNLGPGKKVVVILPDGIRNYMTKFVSDQWMEANLFKEPPKRDFLWWNRCVSNLKINRSVPAVKQSNSCLEAISAMGYDNNVAFVVDDEGFLKGVVSKDSLRFEATNPKKKGNLNFDDVVSKYVMKKHYKIVENKGNPTVGLAARILDIAPFVVVVEEYFNVNNNITGFIPKGIITSEIILDYIIDHQQHI